MIQDAELFTIGPDEIVVTFRTDEATAVTTTAGEHAVTTTGPYHSARLTGLEPETDYSLAVDGAEATALLPGHVTTLAPPPGRLLATFATVNDVHFGEYECGRLGTTEELGPILHSEPGEPPYPSVMNAAAISEIEALDPDAVIVKGDLTDIGSDEQYDQFVGAYTQLGARMHHFRGNHDAMLSDTIAATGPFTVELDGVTLATIDTVRPRSEHGHIVNNQLEWLEDLARDSTKPVLVFGHHHPWDPSSTERNDDYFGINPDDSEALCAVISRCDAIAGYFAGHTHRNRVRRFEAAREVPIVEVACVKDYPGAWAEYRVHEGGYTQLVRRIAVPEAMAWTEKTRNMFAGLYRDYALGAQNDRCFTQLW
ncbi:MAG TPA: metallophosphoesterase family protein [Acidimicrobiia bacterium]|nr:metallophosphoesterase family protein [Acidimicrobiia bacterium]